MSRNGCSRNGHRRAISRGIKWSLQTCKLCCFKYNLNLSGGGGGTPVDGEYEPEKYGVPQIDNVDLDVLGLCTSRTDKACLGDLLNSKCFIGEAEELVEEFLLSTS